MKVHLARILAGLIGLLALVTASAAPGTAAEEPHRVALVIGVGAYQHLPQLQNTVGDAQLLAGTLRGAGFDVALVTDVTRDGLTRAVRDFGRRIEAAGPGTTALLYYAGHGVQDDKQVNYLLGADVDLQSQVDLPIEGLSLDSLLQTIESAKAGISFVILDACRDNPLPVSGERGLRRGLAVEAEHRGQVIAFSTEPGKVALDGGSGGHSPFAAALAEELGVPGLEATQLFRQVTRKVLETTHEQQMPWVTQRLVDDFYFHPKDASGSGTAPPTAPASTVPPPVAALPTAVAPAPETSANDGEVAYGKAVLDNTADGYEAWLRRFPDHPRKTAVLALLQRLREEELWRRVEAAGSASETIAALQIELLAFPNGLYAEKARQRLASLEAPPSAPPDQAAAPPTGPAAAPAAVTPSFNCDLAQSTVEHLICSTPDLAAADRDLANAFSAALGRAASPIDLQQAEQHWVVSRDGCGTQAEAARVTCVLRAYRSRLAELQGGGFTGAPAAPVVPEVQSPSFDCARAGNAAEHLICDVPDLAAADRQLAAVYRAALADSAGPAALAREETRWRMGRDACAAGAPRGPALRCLRDAYAQRIAALQGSGGSRSLDAGDEPGGSARPSFDCARASHPAERLVCASPRLAAQDRDLAAVYQQARSHARSAAALAQAQAAWRARRDACAALQPTRLAVACIDHAYGDRIDALRAALP